jgi:sulfur carrier protein
MTQDTTIAIQLNGKRWSFQEAHTVTTMLEALELHPGMVVVELNRQILDRENYDATEVVQGDTIELVHFVGGG